MRNDTKQDMTKMKSMMNKMMSMLGNQHAPPPPPPSTLANVSQPTIAVVLPAENHHLSGINVAQTMNQVPLASPTFHIFPSTIARLKTTTAKNNEKTNNVSNMPNFLYTCVPRV